MKKSVKISAILLLKAGLICYFVYSYAMKPVQDVSHKKADASLTMAQFIVAINKNDTTFLNHFNDKIIEISGVVKEVITEDSTASITIGDSTSDNSIICQMDKRHLRDVKNVKPFVTIQIKGIGSGFMTDDLGLGNTLQFKNCVITK